MARLGRCGASSGTSALRSNSGHRDPRHHRLPSVAAEQLFDLPDLASPAVGHRAIALNVTDDVSPVVPDLKTPAVAWMPGAAVGFRPLTGAWITIMPGYRATPNFFEP